MNGIVRDTQPVLRVEGLEVAAFDTSGSIRIVDGVSFSVNAGRSLALVGESGSGKSLTCLSIVRTMPAGAQIAGGSIKFDGRELTQLSESQMNAVRGSGIGMVLQDPMTSLNPLLTIGEQVAEMFRYHGGSSVQRIRDRVIDVMKAVNIPAPERRLGSYPHQFSGGMRQRIAIAIAVACQPRLLIADEPTTALDVTIRLQILRLLKDIQRASGMAVVFVTHDLNLVRYFCDDVAVMYAGRIVEYGAVRDLFRAPEHPYTRALLSAVPRIALDMPRLSVIEGQPPLFHDLPAGCRFAPRCDVADDRCATYPPQLPRVDGGGVSCWRSKNLVGGSAT